MVVCNQAWDAVTYQASFPGNKYGDGPILTLEGVDRGAYKHPLESISLSLCEEAGGSPPDPEHDYSSTHYI
jgi:hypothetical protein